VSAVEVIRLTLKDSELLSTRFAEYGNSHRKMEEALTAAFDAAEPESNSGNDDAAGAPTLARLRALRRLERQFAIDLGSLCHRYQRREDPKLHPLERSVLESIALWRLGEEGEDELWIFVDRIRQLRRIMAEEHTEWLEPAQG
jgi:hypothetical protein